MEETIDFKEYLSIGETLLNINGVNFIEPQINIKIRRYLKNQFSIFLTFNTEYNYDNIDYIIAVLRKTVNRTKHRIFNIQCVQCRKLRAFSV